MEFLRVPAVRTQISDERYSPCFCLQSSCSVNRGPSALNSRCSCLGGGGEVFDSLRKPSVFESWIAPVFDERYRHSSRLVRRTPSIPTNGRPCLWERSLPEPSAPGWSWFLTRDSRPKSGGSSARCRSVLRPRGQRWGERNWTGHRPVIFSIFRSADSFRSVFTFHSPEYLCSYSLYFRHIFKSNQIKFIHEIVITSSRLVNGTHIFPPPSLITKWWTRVTRTQLEFTARHHEFTSSRGQWNATSPTRNDEFTSWMECSSKWQNTSWNREQKKYRVKFSNVFLQLWVCDLIILQQFSFQFSFSFAKIHWYRKSRRSVVRAEDLTLSVHRKKPGCDIYVSEDENEKRTGRLWNVNN